MSATNVRSLSTLSLITLLMEGLALVGCDDDPGGVGSILVRPLDF